MSAATAITVLAALAAAGWAYLLLAHGGFWRLREWLPPARDRGAWPAVAALVPARDEAETIGPTVRAILGQDYPGPLHLIVTDDQSRDGTAAVARAAAALGGAGDRLSVVAGSEPPPGWTGKLWALAQARATAQGVAAAEVPAFYWLSDADITHGADTLRRLMTRALDDDRDLVSLMVRLDTQGFWARLLIPPFVFFFRMLYPFAWAADPRRRLAAAAGGCVLLRASALERAGGFESLAGAIIDDCTLAARVKARGRPGGGRIWLGQTAGSHSLRPYRGLGDIWAMVARSAYAQLGFSPWRLAGTVAGLTLLFLAPPAAVLLLPCHGATLAAGLGAAAWLAMAVAVTPTLRHDGRSPLWGAALPLAAALYTAMTLDSARAYARGRGGWWKGRAQAAGPTDKGGALTA